MTTGRVLAASPRSLSQISPGWGSIEPVEDFLFSGARARDVKEILVGEFYHFGLRAMGRHLIEAMQPG